jgi:hypothetical protein
MREIVDQLIFAKKVIEGITHLFKSTVFKNLQQKVVAYQLPIMVYFILNELQIIIHVFQTVRGESTLIWYVCFAATLP